MSFSFDFIPDASCNEANSQVESSSLDNPTLQDHSLDPPAFFSWIQGSPELFRSTFRKEGSYDSISINEAHPPDLMKRIRNEPSLNSDLVDGVYEGGLKVWECSLDLCRYLAKHHTVLDGAILELGCGHGMPGCWALRQAHARGDENTSVVFSDFNDFVLKDATLPNAVLNTATLKDEGTTEQDNTFNWLSQHSAFAAGDWLQMSKEIRASSGVGVPSAVPTDGYFDFIFAAETTYSQKAAEQTATLVAKHLKPQTGVAYIATKRYYFGVGGGSDCFQAALRAPRSGLSFRVEAVEVYDDGASNIRELLKVTFSSA